MSALCSENVSQLNAWAEWKPFEKQNFLYPKPPLELQDMPRKRCYSSPRIETLTWKSSTELLWLPES